jgi:antitoxin (DNA-binding transcriptional repressor) of toxin-antitoxin stability system
MITASVSETRRKLSELIELARNGEDVVIIKDSRPVATRQRIDASDMELVTRVSDRQAQRLHELIDSEPRKILRSADAAVKFLKKEMSGKR